MSDELNDLMWVEATRDLESEASEMSAERARIASSSLWPFLAAARSEPEFDGRLSVAAEHLEAVAVETGHPVEALAADLRGQWRLLAEARGSDPVDHEGHDYDHDDEDPEGDEEDAQNGAEWDKHMGYSPYDHYASLRTALEEGVDPLSWVEDEAEYGSGAEEVGGHQSGATASRDADPKA
jgi:hypothetical protein